MDINNPEPKHQLVDFKPEEIKAITAELEALMAKHSAQFVVSPIIERDGRLGANLQIFQKVELVPKGIPSPFVESNGANDVRPNESGSEEATPA